MSSSGISDAAIQDRAIRLFTYLKELAQLQIQITKDISSYPAHIFFHEVPDYRGCFSILFENSNRDQDSPWLEIQRTERPKRPAIPSSCKKWIIDHFDTDPLAEPQLKDEVPLSEIPEHDASSDSQDKDTSTNIQSELLTEHPEITKEWRNYIDNKWIPWSEEYRTWERAYDIYFRLFSIYEQLKKRGEEYELLLGLGLLKWETQAKRINRHIIVGNALLNFDSNKARFELRGAPSGIILRFETEMIDQQDFPSLDSQQELEGKLQDLEESPWHTDKLNKIMREWVQSAKPDGIFSDSLTPPEKITDKPYVTFAPAIILRKRTQKTKIKCFSTIAESFSNRENITPGVRLLCDITEDVKPLDDQEEQLKGESIQDLMYYLPLAINDEQI